MKTVEIGDGGDISATGATLVSAPSIVEMIVTGAQPEIPRLQEDPRDAFVFNSPTEGKAAEITLEVIKRYERKLGSAEALRDRTFRRALPMRCASLCAPFRGRSKASSKSRASTRSCRPSPTRSPTAPYPFPQIVVLPKKQVTFTFEDFDLASLSTINMRPIEDGIIIEDLRTQARVYLARTLDDPREARPRTISCATSSSATRSTTTPMPPCSTSWPVRLSRA
jgi:type III restriction enzyme